MIKRYNNLSLAFGIPGILLQIIGNIIWRTSEGGMVWFLSAPIVFTGTVLLVVGLGFYAVSKGHSGLWGLCGLLSCVGLIILALLPDRKPHG